MTDDIEIHHCAHGDEKLFCHIAEEVFDDPIIPEERGDRPGPLKACEGTFAVIETAVALKPDEVTYTGSRDHAEAWIGRVHD